MEKTCTDCKHYVLCFTVVIDDKTVPIRDYFNRLCRDKDCALWEKDEETT